jgi:hypothetical protein
MTLLQHLYRARALIDRLGRHQGRRLSPKPSRNQDKHEGNHQQGYGDDQ